ncbi:MAG: metallophosphoesterase [Candidatus Bathyarchaeota archaeon]|nr:metallophosphoesterase [Candidatus Bathyarchaeum sp.]
MIIGIISDTHDNLHLIDQAVKQLNELNVELVLHAGDYIAPFVEASLKQLKAPLIGVFGNNDGDRTLLKKKFAEFGADIRGRFAFVLVDGLRIALIHGDDKELMRSLLELESHDVLVCGHTHVPKTYRKGRMLVINPGEACGLLTGKATIAILDTETLDVKTLQLNK